MRIGQPASAATTAKTLPATEGTIVAIENHKIPPSSGLLIQYPLGEEPQLSGAASTASGLAIRCDRGSGAAITANVGFEFEE
jgi:hypothetical protein